MFYVASIRSPGCLCADAKIFKSWQEAADFTTGARAEDFTHIQECESYQSALKEVEYQKYQKIQR